MAGKKKNPKNRRKRVPQASLEKRYNSRIRQEYIDMDYIKKLDNTKKNCKLPDGTMVTELEYMDLFMREWNNASVPKQAEPEKGKLHRTAKEIKSCTDRNNQRNADIYGIAKARNLVYKMDYETLKEYIEDKETVNYNYVEEAMIDILDKAKHSSGTTEDGDDET